MVDFSCKGKIGGLGLLGKIIILIGWKSLAFTMNNFL